MPRGLLLEQGEQGMTKEELKKEAEKNILNLKNNSIKVSGKPFQINEGDYTQGYLDGAEPREKQIQIDAEQIRALQKQNGELTDKVKELELKLEALEGQTPWKDIKDKSELIGKLTKAKELLKGFVALDKDYDWNLQLAYEAEQFLNEVDKDEEKRT